MRVVIACEYSGTTRDEFAKLGWDAMSCDILPTDKPGKHYQGSIFDVLNDGFDLMIGHPPCTYVSSAGLHFCQIEKHGQKAIDRIKKRHDAVEFFLDLYSSKIPHICLENPVGYLSSQILEPTQIIHPYYFGEREMKRTALWLKNLPALQYRMQDDLFGSKTATEKPEPVQVQIQKSTGKIKRRYFTDGFFNGRLKTGHEKSKSFESIAQAMATQWTEYFLNLKSVAQ